MPSKYTLPPPDLNLPKSWWAKYRLSRTFGSVVSRVPGYELFLRRVEELTRRVRRAAISEEAYRKNRKLVAGGVVENPAEFSSGYGYESAEEETRVARMYKADILSGEYRNRETPALLAEAEAVMAREIQTRGLKRVVNFGVSYAHLDAVLAKRFPEVRFVGIDRSQALCAMNREEFQAISNMEFLASDIFEWIDAQVDLSDTMFMHMRTAILLPEDFVDRLYGKLAAKSATVICGFEPVGVSRETNQFVEQTTEHRRSVFFRDTLIIHNYAGLCTSNGFEVTYLNYVKSNHPDADVRMLSFSAARAG